ncbi:MAG: Rieske (2Fe-2S) protein [Bacteroidota bacterium]
MHRKDFIKTCGLACLGGTALMLSLPGCAGSKIVTGTLSGEDILVPLNAFESIKKNQTTYRSYVVVQNDQLQYPICIFRFSDKEYTALLMQCTHQGAELSVFGDKLLCSAHGSEFDNKGGVQNGPADKSLKTFPVTIEPTQIKISLKKA